MMKQFVFFLFLSFSLSVFSQRLWVVTYFPDMYNNGAAKQIIEHSHIDYNTLNSIISEALVKRINTAFSDTVKIVFPEQSVTTEDYHPVESVWSLLNYTMQPLPDKSFVVIGSHSKLAKKYSKHKKNNGQLTPVIRSTDHSFLDSKITDKTTFSKIAHRIKCNYVLVINEFDVKVDYSNPYATGRNDNKRQIQVHYSLFDNHGKHIAGNIAAVDFSSHENDIQQIINTYFDSLAQQIVDYLKF